MELKIISTDRTEKGKQKMPAQFAEPVRKDLITKIVHALQANKRQPYGAKPKAGQRASAKLSRRRRNYRGSYGLGISRVPRKIMSRRGTRFNWVGACAPGTVGGRQAHPPKASKVWTMKINKKENRKAIRSAISATLDVKLAAERGHIVPEGYPFVIDSKIEGVSKASEAKKILEKLGMSGELDRVSKRKIRAGVGKMRGRRYKSKKGPLFIVSGSCAFVKSCGSIPGVEVVQVKSVNAEALAPGAHIGRLTFFTDKAVAVMEKENLFM